MKKVLIIAFIASAAIGAGCNGIKREPSRVYMPDMFYSRAYETYALTTEQKAELEKKGIHYNGMPVVGTIKRGVDYTFRIPQDLPGDSTNYVASKQIMNPFPSPDSNNLKEAERLYLVNCGICHGSALDGNGPLFKNGDGPFPAKPANLATDPRYLAMPEGQMFYSVTYGKNTMGSYASQLNTTQRWMVIAFIKNRQANLTKGAGGQPLGGTTGAGGNKDSVAAK
jgi:mono/diheme cytochrome c family protein